MTFIVASHNKRKLQELTRILEPMGLNVINPDAIEGGIPEPEENGKTFEENALIKARSACENTGLPAIADDSGLCVDALNGEPGIFSARYAGTNNDDDNNKLLLKNLKNVNGKDRSAYFVSCIACVFPDGREFTVTGKCYGYIGTEPQGDGGFGYDPLFISENGSFGVLTPEEKDKISHRAKSMALFSEKIKEFI